MQQPVLMVIDDLTMASSKNDSIIKSNKLHVRVYQLDHMN